MAAILERSARVLTGDGAFRLLARVLLLVGAIIAIVPYIWMLSSSLKSNADIFSLQVQLIPSTLNFENYLLAWNREGIARFLFNSLAMAVGETIGVLVTSILAGYAFARLRFAGREVLFLIVLGTMMVPAQATLIPSFILVRQLGWIDTYQGLIVPRLVTAFGIFMLRQFFMSIPKDLEDAARVDGCSRIRTLIQIMLPLSGPAVATMAIFAFTQSWNEFFWPLIVVQTPGMRTVQVAIAALKATELVEWGVVMAVVTIASLPTLLVYFAFQRYFVRGIVMSGIKG